MKKYPKYSDIPPLSATDPEIYKFQIEQKERVDRLIAKWGPVLDFTKINNPKAMLIEPFHVWKQEYCCKFVDDNNQINEK